jgi:hypothetical protein
MQRSLLRARIIGAAFGLALLLSGCGVALKLTYNQGPSLLYWWMDGYADFTDEQTPRVRELIDQWFRWNRREALPDYAALLVRAQAQVQEPTLTPQAICAVATEGRSRMLQAFEQAVPSMAEVAVGLSAEQVQHIDKRFAKNNAKFSDEFLPSRPEDRRRAEAKKMQERVEMIYGSVTDAQQDRIAAAVAASPYDAALFLTERRALQQEGLQLLRSLQTARSAGQPTAQLMSQAQAGLRTLAQHTMQSPREAYRARQQKVWDHNCEFAAQMHNSTDAEQRRFAARKIKRWEDDVRTLAAQAAK